MANPPNSALLPAGLQDVLAPDAAHEAAMVEHLLGTFATWGYQRVKPPLVEFEHSLLEGAGAAMSSETFRLMDPVSQSMMGIRTDMTLQVARIAASRLKEDPRPLRLSYAGDVLRVRGSQLRPERQFVQVGGELIGAAGPAADTEVVAMAVRALRAIGLDRLSVDLTFPTLISSLYQALEIGGKQEDRLRSALDSKDRNAVLDALPDASDARTLFLALLEATGPAEAGLAILDNAALPQGPRKMIDHLVDVASRLRDAVPDLALTLDPVEYRGFEYHAGIGFTIYRNGTRGEIGAGGRYLAGSGFRERTTEPATGFTLFLDTIIRSLCTPQAPPQVYAPYGMSLEAVERLRADGMVVVAGLEPEDDPEAEARHLGCRQIIENGMPRNLAAEGSG